MDKFCRKFKDFTDSPTVLESKDHKIDKGFSHFPAYCTTAMLERAYVRTSTSYALAPFIESALSFLVFREAPSLQYLLALVITATGAILAAKV